MFSKPPTHELNVNYPISDSNLPFSEYIKLTRELITKRRPDLAKPNNKASIILDANSPFEFYPEKPIQTARGIKYGALLIHGLLDSPFSVRDIGIHLQKHGILARSILLPGHGTTPADLIRVSYHDWLQSVRYAVETLRHEVDHIFLIGYSTGAALSIYQAIQDAQISGIILLSPAIRIKAPVHIVVGWHYFLKWFGRNNREWLYQEPEIDYAKYQSIPFNPINQVNNLTKVIHEIREHRPLTTPIFMAMSYEDETVSSERAIEYFSSQRNEASRFLLYSAQEHAFADSRITPRLTHYRDLNIKHFSHAAIPFAENNTHYGNRGDYISATNTDAENVIYGAYNQLERDMYQALYNAGLTQCMRKELTFNPDFEYMNNRIVDFIQSQ